MATARDRQQKERKRVTAKRFAQDSGFGSNYLSVPSDASFWNPKKEGVYEIDIIPFIAGPGNPHADEGEWTSERTIHVHTNVGANEKRFICPAETSGEPCPICEYRAQRKTEGKRTDQTEDDFKDEIRNLYASRRQVWNIFDRDNVERGVQIWDVSNFLFGKHLQNKINTVKTEDERQRREGFADPVDGLTIRIGATTADKGKWLEYKDIEFVERAEPIPDEIVEATHCFDSMLNIESYEKLNNVFYQVPGATEETTGDDADQEAADAAADEPETTTTEEEPEAATEEEAPAEETPEEAPEEETAPASAGQTAEECGIKLGSMVKHADHGRCEVVKISPDGTSLTIEDDDGNVHRAVDPAECAVAPKATPAPATKPATKPVTKPATPAAKPATKPAPAATPKPAAKPAPAPARPAPAKPAPAPAKAAPAKPTPKPAPRPVPPKKK